MRLFDVGERVVEGWPVSSDRKKKRLYLELGKDKGHSRTQLYLRFGSSLVNALFPEASENPEMLEDLWLLRGGLMKDAYGICLTTQLRADTEALVRSYIAPGVGGEVTYKFNGVQVLAEGVGEGIGETEDVEFPVYLLRMPKGSSFTVNRTGSLEDQEGSTLPPSATFSWTGLELKVT